MTRRVTPKGKAVIKSFEGRALKAYKCPANVWTIGYGNTNHDAYAVSVIGKIGPGVTITEAQAELLLDNSLLKNYCPAVEKAMPGASDGAYDAGTSFHYNTGAIGRASWVKLWRAKQDMKAALLSWNKGGGRVLAGLDRRRKREYAMITVGDYGPEGRNAPPVLSGANGKVTGTVGTEPPTTNNPHYPGLMKRGDKGDEVRAFKADLRALGMTVKAEDDNFEATTEAQVRKFQTAHKQLNVDGVVGPATRAAIKREADMARQLKTGGSVTGGPSGSVILADQANAQVTGAAQFLPTWAYVLLGLLFVGTVCYIGFKYRDELLAKIRRG